jgi:hypothetical protein
MTRDLITTKHLHREKEDTIGSFARPLDGPEDLEPRTNDSQMPRSRHAPLINAVTTLDKPDLSRCYPEHIVLSHTAQLHPGPRMISVQIPSCEHTDVPHVSSSNLFHWPHDVHPPR